MHNTQLHLRLWKYHRDRFREPLQPVHAGDEDVGHAPVVQIREHL